MVVPQTFLSNSELSAISEAPFLRACRLLKSEYTPVWLMRQAGRFLPEYRAMRTKFGFLELCKKPEAAAEVTLMRLRN